jgi:glycopeptide antibiotics resistance protein
MVLMNPKVFALFYVESGTTRNIIWQYMTLYIWQLACIIYCIVVLTIIVVKLFKVSKQLGSTSIGGNTATSHYEKNILKKKAIISAMVKRIIWYPVVPIIAQGAKFYG